MRAEHHVPLVFIDPTRFQRAAFAQEKAALEALSAPHAPVGDAHRYVLEVSRSAAQASEVVRAAWSKYKGRDNPDLRLLDLDKVAALIEADFPTQLYYVPLRNSLFDTHVNQASPHDRQLLYCSDAIAGFFQEMERIGRADDVVMYVYSEFGRRVPENTSLGTDHGTAQVNFVIGNAVKGGFYGTPPSLTELVLGDNLANTTDFRQVYATPDRRLAGRGRGEGAGASASTPSACSAPERQGRGRRWPRASAGRPGRPAWKDDLTPIGAGDWNDDRAAHLLAHAGFGGTPAEVRALADAGLDRAVRSLVHYESIPNPRLQPFVESGLWDPSLNGFPESRPEATDRAAARGTSMGVAVKPAGSRPVQPVSDRFFYWLRATMLETRRLGYWWANRMLQTTHPVEQKMALLWHGHFATHENKVRDYRKMVQQVALFERARPATCAT